MNRLAWLPIPWVLLLAIACGAPGDRSTPESSVPIQPAFPTPTPTRSPGPRQADEPTQGMNPTDAPLTEIIAGSDIKGNDGDGGPATEAQLFKPIGLTVAPDGTMYVAECDPNAVTAAANRVRRISADGVIDTIAGGVRAEPGFSGDGGPATDARFNCPFALAADEEGNVYVADLFNNRVRMIDRTGVITTIAGTGHATDTGDGGLANEASLNLPGEVLLTPDGGLLIASGPFIRQVAADGTITTIAGGGTPPDAQLGVVRWTDSQEGKPAIDASFSDAGGMTWGPDGSLYFADFWDNRVLKIDSEGVLHSVAGDGTKPENADTDGDGGSADDANLRSPQDVAMGPDGSLYILEHYGYVRRITPDGIISTFDLGWYYDQAQSIVTDGDYLYVADREGAVVVRAPIDQ